MMKNNKKDWGQINYPPLPWCRTWRCYCDVAPKGAIV